MQPGEALENRNFERTEETGDSPIAGELSVMAASESQIAKPDFGAEPTEPEQERLGNGTEAEFMLESTAVCPHCLEDIDKVQIVRMLRTKVNFVSSLPRRGQLLICPKCRIALAGALGGLL